MTRPSYREFAVSVSAARDLSPSFRRLTLTGPDLTTCGDALLDQRVKIVLGSPAQLEQVSRGSTPLYDRLRALAPDQRPVVRTYTLSGVDRRRGTVTIDFACRPEHGPAAAFAAAARGGEPLLLIGPDALSPDAAGDGIAWNPGSAREVLLVGDETALPAIRNIVNALPAGTFGTVVLDLPSPEDAVGLRPPPGVDVLVARDGQRFARATELVTHWLAGKASGAHHAVNEPDDELLWEEAAHGTGPRYVWAAGEAGWVRDLRRLLLGSGAATKAQASFMGYWKAGAASLG